MTKQPHVFLVGIKGQGMTALALLLQVRGSHVEGSDVAETFSTDAVLSRAHISIRPMDSPLPDAVDVIIHSTAYDRVRHPQLREAAQRELRIQTYPEALGTVMASMESIAVAGSHGKTTTTAMLGAIFIAAGKDPTVVVGSPVPAFGGNARIGRHPLLIMETDEYQDKFRHYLPRHLLVTNIDYDHPDFFPSAEAYHAVFRTFITKAPPEGKLVVRADDVVLSAIVQTLTRAYRTFGKGSNADFSLLSSDDAGDHQVLRFRAEGQDWTWRLSLPGEHNALNALGATAMARAFGIAWETIERALTAFAGVARRFELVGTHRGALLIDDYAHHPAEITAAIAGARQRYPGRHLIAVFHPHTYSRTKVLLDDFARSLTADEVIVMDIFGSAREKEQSVTSEDLVAKIPPRHHPRVLHTVTDVAADLRGRLTEQDIVLLLGAGEQWRVAKELQGTEK